MDEFTAEDGSHDVCLQDGGRVDAENVLRQHDEIGQFARRDRAFDRLFAAGVGLVPLPLADLAALVAANLKMLRDLANHYGVEFREEMAKSAIASLLAAAGVPALVMPAVSLIKLIPGAGSLVGGLTVPALAGGLTYATGRVFIRHFESGGTFLDFNADRFKSMFKKEMKEGQEKAKEAAAAA